MMLIIKITHYVVEGTSKECVVGIIERNGNVKLFHAKNKSIKSEDLMKIVKENVDINNSILWNGNPF